MLKSLDLFGFKSFADRTTFDFAEGITCVVGPNGSGKSNVVDAIKWIMGDQSPKSLRGKEMTDVIFNGSGSRKPTGFAEATLTFDNTNRMLSIDSFEVQVGRRLYRTGEAEYLINRVPARLKDVRDLFLGTGAGTSAYSIIEQGRVDALLQTTTVNRRVVFEEAAGISRFKARKIDAQRKLERVGQNLLRLTDIVEEVRGQLETLRTQAAKAMRFREYTEELRTLRIGLAADDHRQWSAQLLEIGERMHGFVVEQEKLTIEHQGLEAEQAGVDRRLNECEDLLREAEKAAAENREASARHEATIQHQEARKTELEAESARLMEQEAELAIRAQNAVGELRQTVGDLEQYAAAFAGRKASLEACEIEIQALRVREDELRDALEQDRTRQLELHQQASILEHRLADFRSQSSTREASRNRAVLRREQVERQIGASRAELERCRLTLEEVGVRSSSLRAEIAELQSKRQELLAIQEELQRSLAEDREQRSAGQARRHLLEDLERRQEGLGIGVKEILSRAQGAAAPPWNTVLGSVVDLLVVELEDAALLEVALGNRAQVIVLSEYGSLIEYVSQGKCRISGRVGFVAVANESGADEPSGDDAKGQLFSSDGTKPPVDLAIVESLSASSFPDLSGHAGVINRADRLVKSASGIHRLAERLLADTWIVESLPVALALAASAGKGCRFVTLQGELLEPDGSLYVGALGNEMALVSRKSELRGLKRDLARLDRQVDAKEQEIAQLGESHTALDRTIASRQTEFERLSGEMTELKSKLGSQELDLERLRRDRDEIETEISQWSAEQERLDAESARAREQLANAGNERETLQRHFERTEQDLAQCLRDRQELHDSQTAANLELAKQEERLHNLQHARTRLDQEQAERSLQQAEAERRLHLVVAKRDQIEEHLGNTRVAVEELAGVRQEQLAKIAGLQSEKDRIREDRTTLAEREMRVRHERRELKERHHSLEMQVREIQQQIQHLEERIRDEYQVALAESAAAGESAIRTYRAKRERGTNSAKASDENRNEPIRQDAESAQSNDDLPSSNDEWVTGAANAIEASAPTMPDAEDAMNLDPESLRSVRAEVEEKIDRLRRKLKSLGNINTDSLRDLDEMEARHARLKTQLDDLVEAKMALEEIVRRINSESKRMFTDTFGEIRKHFQELFRKLFGGGEGDIVLEDPEDVLECGIEVVARPPGKELRSISLLSGGEKTLTAVALLMAIFQSRPSPFCILDEVDAALDEGNVERYMRVVQEFRETTQFIVITHSKRTMTAADVIYGVTMEEAGVSKRMAVRFEDVSEDGHFETTPPASEAA